MITKTRYHLLSLFAVAALVFSSVTVPQTAYATDISITTTSVAMSSAGLYKTNYVAGEAITEGQAVYVNANDGKVYKAKATSLATSSLSASGGGGIAINSQPTAGQFVAFCYYDPSFTLGGTIASGGIVLASSANFGGLTSTAADLSSGNIGVFVGIGIGGNKIFLNPTQGGALP